MYKIIILILLFIQGTYYGPCASKASTCVVETEPTPLTDVAYPPMSHPNCLELLHLEEHLNLEQYSAEDNFARVITPQNRTGTAQSGEQGLGYLEDSLRNTPIADVARSVFISEPNSKDVIQYRFNPFEHNLHIITLHEKASCLPWRTYREIKSLQKRQDGQDKDLVHDLLYQHRQSSADLQQKWAELVSDPDLDPSEENMAQSEFIRQYKYREMISLGLGESKILEFNYTGSRDKNKYVPLSYNKNLKLWSDSLLNSPDGGSVYFCLSKNSSLILELYIQNVFDVNVEDLICIAEWENFQHEIHPLLRKFENFMRFLGTPYHDIVANLNRYAIKLSRIT